MFCPNDIPFLKWIKGTGEYQAFITPMNLPRTAVQSMLPDELELAPQSVTPDGTHPVVLMFGRQNNVHPKIIPVFHSYYLEFVFGVPYVQWKDPNESYRGPFFFMPRLFLNKIFPIFLGLFYGYDKKLTSIGMDDDAYIIDDLTNNETIIDGRFQSQGKPGPADRFPNFQQVIPDLLQQPFVGQSHLGFYICSNFNWHFDQAKIEPVEATVTISKSFLSNLPVGEYHLPSLYADPFGCFFLDTKWTLGLPMQCNCVDE